MKRLFYLLFCFSLYGCSDTKPQKPANLIRQEKMVQILADIHTIEAQVERAILYPDTALMTFNHYQQEVIEKHGVSEQDFRNTYRYYLVNLDQLDKLYEIVIDTLSIREIKAGKEAAGEVVQQEQVAAAETPVAVDTAAVPVDTAAVADTVTAPGTIAGTDTTRVTPAVARRQEDWRAEWICKIYQFRMQPYTVSPTSGTLPYYLAPTIHDLPHACLGQQ